jgi:2'-5' RNA ligase
MRKINIHLTLDSRALAYCHEVNAGIRRITTSIIEFSESSRMIPHISLIMGQLLDHVTLEEVARITAEVVSTEKVLVFRVDGPYLENVRNRYVFSDVHGGDAFLNLRQRLHARLNGSHLVVQSDYTEQAHLTLGHVEDRREEVRAYLQSVRAGFDVRCPAAEISDAGPKGTCVNSLFRFDFPLSETSQSKGHCAADI